MDGFERLVGQLCAALRAHLAGGRPQPPEAGQPLWRAFCELHRGRRRGPDGPEAISSEAVAAWAALARMPLAPRHVDALRRMDAVWLDHVAGGPAAVSRAPITPALFDAMMGGIG